MALWKLISDADKRLSDARLEAVQLMANAEQKRGDEATVALREAAEARREGAEARREGAEARREGAEARRKAEERSDERARLMDKIGLLEQRTTELARAKGCMMMPGIFDFVENELDLTDPDLPKQQTPKWQGILEKRPELKNCLVKHHLQHSQDAKVLAQFVASIYATLSDHNHGGRRREEFLDMDYIIIREGPLSKCQCQALKCIADAFCLPAQIHLIPETDEQEQPEETLKN